MKNEYMQPKQTEILQFILGFHPIDFY